MEKIAIIGLGCLFPDAATPQQYWRNLLEGRDSSSPLSADELDADPALYQHPQAGTPDKIGYCTNGHVRGFAFDPEGYRLPAEQLRQLDPLFHWTLYAADQALKDSGRAQDGAALARCGLIVGNIGMPTHAGKKLMNGFYQQALEPYLQTLIGRGDFRFHQPWEAGDLAPLNLNTVSANATVAAQALGLGGPCFALDAACASALYAIRMASYYLESGKADLMLAGAVCHADHIYIDHGFNVLQAFPTDGASIPFDSHSQGLKAGEGSSLIALKRHADAVRDGDRIYGVIESIGLSNDGGAKHILVPDAGGQTVALQRAYDGIARDIDYLECHATGTPVGDQVELSTVEAFFDGCARRPLIGANKGNVGHMLTASGMASILKVLLAMRHGVIPPTLGVRDMVPTPAGRLDIGHVVRTVTPWPQGGSCKRAGVNAFGFGGVNGHMVLAKDDADAPRPPTPVPARMATLAITGTAVLLADTDSNEAFDAVVLGERSLLRPVPRTRWLGLEQRADLLASRGLAAAPSGAYIEQFEFDCKRFRLPPKVIGTHLLSHLLLMPLAERAYLDAGYAIDGSKRNIAVLVAGDIDYSCLRYQARNEMAWQVRDSLARCGIALTPVQVDALERIAKDALFPEPYPEGITGGIGNVAASRIAAHLKLDGPAFFVGAHESAAFKALELAQFMLSEELVEAVIVAGGAFAGGIENVLFAEPEAEGGVLPPGDGAGVVVLRRAQDAQASGERIYAIVRGLAIEHDCVADTRYRPSSAATARAAAAALEQACVAPDAIGYIERAGGGAAVRAAELEGLGQAYAARAEAPDSGSIGAICGDLAGAKGLLGMIKMARLLYLRHLPGGAAWPAPAGGARLAAVSSLGQDRAYAHLVLEEPDERNRATARIPAPAATAASSLVTTVHTGRAQTMAELILNPENHALFGTRHGVAPVITTQTAAKEDLADHLVLDDPLHREVLRNAGTQLHYLRAEQQFYRRMAALIGGDWHAASPVPAPVFDYEQLVELTVGSVAAVLGPDYAEADTYAVRTRMPSPPYMFASRITALSARQGVLEPCHVEWECDLPHDAWYVNAGMVPAFVALESSHAMIVAFTYIGCDQLFKGELRYRAVDSQTTVYGEMPRAGEVLRGRVNIKSFLRVGRNVLVTYEFLCHVGERLVFRLEANSGFFLPKDIEKSKGVDPAPYLKTAGKAAPFAPPLRCERSQFGEDAIAALMRADLGACFGPAWAVPRAIPLCSPAAQMLHRVVRVDPEGGPFGLGQLEGECDIDPAHWVFQAHFMNDPVMPGTMLVEGCEQMVRFFLSYLGLYGETQLTPHVLTNHRYSAKFRGEVKCERETLRYRLTCKGIEQRRDEEGALAHVALVFLAEIIYRGNVIGICDNLGAGFSSRAYLDGAHRAQPASTTEAYT